MATEQKPLTTAWVLIGSGPTDIETKILDNAHIHFGDTLPAAASEASHDMFGRQFYPYRGTQNIYARSRDSNGAQVIVTPIV